MRGHPCPVCDYPNLSEPPRSEFGGGSFEICPSCGFQFGVNDDAEGISYETWRRRWEARDMPWSGVGIKPPANWKPVAKFVAPGGAALRRPGESQAEAARRDDAAQKAAANAGKAGRRTASPTGSKVKTTAGTHSGKERPGKKPAKKKA
jgi:hypothetical protein